MKNSDKKFKVLVAGILIFISYLVLNSFTDLSVNAQSQSTFLTLSGSNFLDVKNSERLQLDKFTLSTWFSTDKQDFVDPGMIVNKGGMNDDAPGKNMNYGLWITPTELLEGGFETKSGTNLFITSKNKFNDGNWHHAVLTYDGSVLKLYVDGNEEGQVSTLKAVPDNTGTQPIRIGANSFAEDKFFTGEVDEVMLWDRALSFEEISNSYNFDEFPLNGRILYLSFSSVSPIQSTYNYGPFKTFDGSEKDEIDEDEQLFHLSNFSAASWFRSDRIDHDEVGILLNRGGFGSELQDENLNYGIWLNPSETIEAGFETSSGTNVFVTTLDKFNDGLWHYAVLTYDGKTLKLYVDGILVDDKITSGILPDLAGDTKFVIAGDSVADDKFFKGDLDEIRVWNRAISSDEVLSGFKNNIFNIDGQIFYESYSGESPPPPPQQEECPAGQHFDTTTNTCVPDLPPPPPQQEECPAGQHLDTTTNTCVPDLPPPPPQQECPAGLHLENGQCVPDLPPQQTGTGFLLVVTNVMNDDNGSKQASDFTVSVNGNRPLPKTFSGIQSPTATSVAINQGDYSVSLKDNFGYETDFLYNCADTIHTEETRVCVINIDDPTPPPPPQGCPVGQHLENGQCVPDSPPPPGTGFLLVITDVVNNNGGTKTSSDIDITVNGNNPVPSNFKGSQTPLGKIIALTEGEFSLTVNNNFGYQTKFLHDCAGTVKAQETNVCVINLDDPITTVSSGSPQGCPAGQHFDQTTQTCVPDLPPPPQGTFVPFNFGAAGDWNCNSNSEKTVQSILSKDPEIVLGLGDYSYQSNANCWLDVITPLNDKMKITIGNHDSDEEEGPEITEQFLDHFNLDKQYYSFIEGNTLFISMSTQVSFSENSEQFNFVKSELEKAAQDNRILWKVVYFHKPAYAAPTKHEGEASLRDTYHPLFDQYKVDLVLSGHNHNYQRTFPIHFNPDDSSKPIIVNTDQNTYNNVGAPLFITSGTGGVSLHALGTKPDFNVKQLGKFGHLNIDVTGNNGEKLVGTFVDNDGNQLDQFTITKSIGPSLSPLALNSQQAGSAGVDVFGMNKIYPTKPGGEEWFMNMENLKSDPRLKVGTSTGDIIKNQDGSWSPVSQDKVILNVYTSSVGEFNKGNVTTFNLKELAKNGHWFKENDWLNIEMGGYFKLNSTNDLSLGYSFFPRSIDHSNDHGGCGGATPVFTFGFNGVLTAKKEMWFSSLISSAAEKIGELSPSIVDKWIGMKAVIYNLPNKDVKQEFWMDKDNNGKWEKVYEFTDKGGFGISGETGPEKCGGEWDQRYTWGSPKVTFKWNQADVEFKNLSVREIIPPK